VEPELPEEDAVPVPEPQEFDLQDGVTQVAVLQLTLPQTLPWQK
jgi:hypothetical protein